MAFRLPADTSLRSYTDGSALCDSCVTNFYAEPRFGSLVGGATTNLSYGQWKQAIADGCPLCLLIFDHLDAAFPYSFADMSSDEDLELTLAVKEWNTRLCAGWDSRDWAETIGFLEIDISYVYSDSKRLHLILNDSSRELMVFLANEDDATGSIVKARDDVVDLRQPDALLKVYKSLRECTTTHQPCHVPTASQIEVPARLIQVSGFHDTSGDNDLKLVLTDTVDGLPPYLALSYCWGGPQTCKTEVANHEQRLSGFSSSELDKTIRDAVEVTRAMHVEYLWVDAHCIIQDSDEDKRKEISAMGNIFWRALATIVVEAASASSEGFLNLYDRRPCTNVPFRCSEDVWGTLQVHSVSREPPALGTRAWTLQEIMLSQRQIIFGQNTLSWKCAEQSNDTLRSRLQIELLSGQVIASVFRGLIVETDLANDTQARELDSDDPSAHLQASFWTTVIHEYSGRDLTEEQDKLLAISAWAKKVSQVHSWTYVAGLWRDWLELGLCWCRAGAPRFPFVNLKPRPKTYIAPSWSWASVTGQCTWRLPFSEKEQFKLVCRVEDVVVNLHNSYAIYGRLTGGSLKISAPLVAIDFLSGKHPFDLSVGVRMMHNPLTVLIQPDTTESYGDMYGDIYFLILTRRRETDHQVKKWQSYVQQQQEAGNSCENKAVSDLESAIWAQYGDNATFGSCKILDATNLVSCEGMILVRTAEDAVTYRRTGYFEATVRSTTLELLERRLIVVI